MARHSGRGLYKEAKWESVVFLTAEEQALLDALVAESVTVEVSADAAAIVAGQDETVAEVEAFLASER